LLIIAGEAFAHAKHKLRIKRRTKRLFVVRASGEELHRKGPNLMSGQEQTELREWMAEVSHWVTQTEDLLGKYSSQALASFRHDEKGLGLKHRIIAENSQGVYAHLTERLNNLRDIIEKADVYL
jgi:hypothetical protein